MAGDVCDVCERPDEKVVGVAAVPGVPMSLAYCETCLRNHAWGPLWLAENNAEMIGGMEHAADWFKQALVFKDGEYVTVEEALA